MRSRSALRWRDTLRTLRFFIAAVNGIAISNLILERLEELIQQPDEPGVYWALTDLPRPFIDLRRPLQGEHIAVYGTFPGLAEATSDLNAKAWTPEQVEAVEAVFQRIDKASSLLGEKAIRKSCCCRAAQQEGMKKLLIIQGRPKELVEAMPDVQAAMLLALRHFDEKFDELLKWQSLPFWEAYPAMVKAEEEPKEKQDGKERPTLAFGATVRPTASRIFAAQARIDRRIAATGLCGSRAALRRRP